MKKKVLVIGTDSALAIRAAVKVAESKYWLPVVDTSQQPLSKKLRNELAVCVAVTREEDADSQALLHSWMKVHIYGRGITVDWWTVKG